MFVELCASLTGELLQVEKMYACSQHLYYYVPNEIVVNVVTSKGKEHTTL